MGSISLATVPMSFPGGSRFTGVRTHRAAEVLHAMGYKLEMVLIPVSDVDRAKKFYTGQLGFDLLVDTRSGRGSGWCR